MGKDVRKTDGRYACDHGNYQRNPEPVPLAEVDVTDRPEKNPAEEKAEKAGEPRALFSSNGLELRQLITLQKRGERASQPATTMDAELHFVPDFLAAKLTVHDPLRSIPLRTTGPCLNYEYGVRLLPGRRRKVLSSQRIIRLQLKHPLPLSPGFVDVTIFRQYDAIVNQMDNIPGGTLDCPLHGVPRTTQITEPAVAHR